MKCKICSSVSEFLFEDQILYKHNIKYYKCNTCNFIQTEEPFWLEEAYSNAITSLDLGLVKRNLYLSNIVAEILKKNMKANSTYLDYAAGYGLFVRLMRDRGFDFNWYDKYCENIFAKNFEVKENKKYDLLTAFEVFEHLVNPLEEIEKMFQFSDTILFSEDLTDKITDLKAWWYFSQETGQHISFYSIKTLKYIADKFELNLYTDKNIHILSKRKFKGNPAKVSFIKKVIIELCSNKILNMGSNSLIQSDIEFIKKLELSNKK